MGDLRKFTGGKPSHEKIEDAVQAVHDALWEHLQGQPLTVVLGVLKHAKYETLQNHEG